MKYVLAVWRWSMGARWRTWAFHGLLAFVLSGLVGAIPMMWAYVWGEGKETLTDLSVGVPIDPVDRLMDLGVPFMCAGLAMLAGWDALVMKGAAAVLPGAKALLGV